jgi:2-polyprenyl-3-methyl-5-hydroxy-6-metoxy-1,4-benzoquinol methylase
VAHNVTLEDVQRFWEAHPLYAGESPLEPGTREFFEAHLKMTLHEYGGQVPAMFLVDVQPGVKVLDVGCGIGFWLSQFCARGARVTACDLTERAVAMTRRRAELYGFQAEVQQGNAELLPFAEASFDHVNCQGVIHHTPDTAACIREWARVLRPGGTACFSVYFRALVLRSPLLFALVTRLLRPVVKLPGRGRETMLSAATPDELVRQYDGAQNPLGKCYTRPEMEKMILPHLRILQVLRFGFPRKVFPFAIPDFVHRVLSRCFGLMIAFRCQKAA